MTQAAIGTSGDDNFLRRLLRRESVDGAHAQLLTRFPPEPNGQLHIGHARAICLNFGLAEEFSGRCNLRLDDTNPLNAAREYGAAIAADVRWLGYRWAGEVRHTSDYFDRLRDCAEQLINAQRAYVCELSSEEIREQRGNLREPGQDSPHRDRSQADNLRLFQAMCTGRSPEGSAVLRARIDMRSPNMQLRDPVLYRTRHHPHWRSGSSYYCYPTYDFSHCLSDYFEGVSHSLCTLEFVDHEPLYNWLLDALELPAPRPRQIEFGKLTLSHTLNSKRRLQRLVAEGRVSGWDDPRLTTLSGLRRRGYTPSSIRAFCHATGIGRNEGIVDLALLEHSIRDELNRSAPRAMCVLHPLRLQIENYPDSAQEQLMLPVHPQYPERGSRELPFSAQLFIDRDDFSTDPPKGFKRLAPGRSVRLRGAYVIRCDAVEYGDDGEPSLLRCSYDANTLGAKPDYAIGGVIHWVPATASVAVTVRLYERLFTVSDPASAKGDAFLELLNPDSLVCLEQALAEPAVAVASSGEHFQFERCGYFCVDPDSRPDRLVFNRTVALRDRWVAESGK